MPVELNPISSQTKKTMNQKHYFKFVPAAGDKMKIITEKQALALIDEKSIQWLKSGATVATGTKDGGWVYYYSDVSRARDAAPAMIEALIATTSARNCAIIDDEFPALLHNADNLRRRALMLALPPEKFAALRFA